LLTVSALNFIYLLASASFKAKKAFLAAFAVDQITLTLKKEKTSKK
jgi:hypothetical protein